MLGEPKTAGDGGSSTSATTRLRESIVMVAGASGLGAL